ncbi:hypothetical protein [Solimicrobium silvestre]|uniref:Uncharacterized protein n=1 Tax=Solimicrobium silvestre TaxID=2099400 RepID=A0A2S9GY56_9BURK|nr:hypothetical protein [Solimicrobium silvestre]PRC92657.1 hypothetical protein S2091_2712 [Solimicrobium silvestre]
MIKPKRIFDHETVLAFIQENAGTKYTGAVLARIFKVDPSEMRAMLQKMHSENLVESISGHCKYFFISKATVENLIFPTHRAHAFKPYVQPKNMGERCKELYPSGHSFIAMGRES